MAKKMTKKVRKALCFCDIADAFVRNLTNYSYF